jgi:uncharacterized membrane protein
MFIAIFSTFWLWMLSISNFPVNTKGWLGNITLILQFLYVLGLPMLGIAAIVFGLVAVVKRSASAADILTIMFMVVGLGFWAWSLSPSGQFDLSWRK